MAALSFKEALCREYDPELWFPGSGGRAHDIDIQIAICHACGDRMACLDLAFTICAEGNGIWGVWGGLPAHVIRRIAASRRGKK